MAAGTVRVVAPAAAAAAAATKLRIW